MLFLKSNRVDSEMESGNNNTTGISSSLSFGSLGLGSAPTNKATDSSKNVFAGGSLFGQNATSQQTGPEMVKSPLSQAILKSPALNLTGQTSVFGSTAPTTTGLFSSANNNDTTII